MANSVPTRCWILVLACVVALGLGSTQSARAQTFTVLYSFKGPPDGESPYGALLRDPEGNLYSTTEIGGAQNFGTVFRVSPGGQERVLHSFGATDTDGQEPYAGLLRDEAGNLYGTTLLGGDYSSGTLFKIDAGGTYRVLYSFGEGFDGSNPRGALVMDKAGNLYGTTMKGGGGSGCNGAGCGTVFEFSALNGQEIILHSFNGAPDGANPERGLVKDWAGNLYGTTFSGGTFNYGTVFNLSTTGEETVLYSFKGPPDGAYPWAALQRDSAGNLFGTTLGGGKSKRCYPGCGTVFKLTKSGKESVVHSFSGFGDGAQPYGSLVENTSGNLYGTTSAGGNSSCACGTVFRLVPNGTFTTIHRFNGTTDGWAPSAGLTLDSSGNIYGTASGGGTYDYAGTVWRLTP